MKDLKIYYQSDDGRIDSAFDKKIEKLAKEFGLSFQGSGVEIGKGIRDIHYRKEK
ncbi:MAG: hypothetical protein KAT69_09165 [Candidatus Aminicenantes bacterium]|nr:hypothetical protein [Candidatus Aminicenantes bacterium]